MKKFTLIPVGENFEFQGERYSKTGPLTASSVDGKRQRMIPRSAMVKSLSAPEEPETPPAAQCATLDAATTLSAFEQYHNGCLEWLRLAEKELSEETAGQIRAAMDCARTRLLAQLKANATAT
jgi:hypothetical protein